MLILVINSGSTSLKYSLFNFRNFRVIKRGVVEDIGDEIKNHEQALNLVLENIGDLKNIKAVGHRVVHGGIGFIKPTRITLQVLKRLEKYNKLAPLHNPSNILGIRAAKKLIPRVPNIAVFDTAFHQTISEQAFRYALPEKYYRKYCVRRFGFHGISHQYAVEEAARIVKKSIKNLKIISCHLGGGASICAVKNGKSIDTSMGFTPAEGLVMMTRCGDIDPTIPLFLQREEKLSVDKVDKILNEKSGMLALCGFSDMKKILKKASRENKKAKLALKIYTYRIKKYIGAYFAILGGCDILIFTGAIGYESRKIRNMICKDLKILKNVKILPIKTNEEMMIAREVKKYLHKYKSK